VVRLISVKPRNPESWMFHRPCVEYTPLQAEAMGLPLTLVEVSGEKEVEIEELKEALTKLKDELKVEGLACGAVQSRYQRSRIEKICRIIGLKMLTPLWGENPESLLWEMLNLEFEVVFTAVAAFGMDEKWLGRRLNSKTIEDLKKLNMKFKVNLALEGGEAETFVLDACFFNKRIELLGVEKIWFGDWGYLKVKDAKLKNKFD
jgi:ABC transporter with metal-binding/Fe-S-binding domain ATP-binding protein